MRNNATNMKRDAKMLEECKIIEESKKIKITYKFVRSKTKRREQLEAIQKQDGTFIKCDQETAEVLNSEFKKVFTKTGLLTEELKDQLQNKSGCSDDVKMSISREEIIAAIRSLEEGKAPEPDEVSTSFLLSCEQEMLIPLLIIFDKSYDEGKIPKMWRYANVIPVYKNGLKTIALNHRPVSLTCVICKMKCRLMTGLSQKK